MSNFLDNSPMDDFDEDDLQRVAQSDADSEAPVWVCRCGNGPHATNPRLCSRGHQRPASSWLGEFSDRAADPFGGETLNPDATLTSAGKVIAVTIEQEARIEQHHLSRRGLSAAARRSHRRALSKLAADYVAVCKALPGGTEEAPEPLRIELTDRPSKQALRQLPTMVLDVLQSLGFLSDERTTAITNAEFLDAWTALGHASPSTPGLEGRSPEPAPLRLSRSEPPANLRAEVLSARVDGGPVFPLEVPRSSLPTVASEPVRALAPQIEAVGDGISRCLHCEARFMTAAGHDCPTIRAAAEAAAKKERGPGHVTERGPKRYVLHVDPLGGETGEWVGIGE